MKYAFVGCSSSSKITDESFVNGARRIGQALVNNNYGLVFGACNYGLMGEVYRTMKSSNSSVIGVAPTLYKDDFKTLQCDEEYAVDTTNERISLMINKSDIIIFLAGGTGTLEEIIVTIEMKRRREIDKPIIIYDETSFYQLLVEQLNNMERYSFSDNCSSLFDYINDIETLDKYLNSIDNKINVKGK